MGSGSVARGSASSRLHNHKESKYASASHYYYSPVRQRTPSPPRRVPTQAELNEKEEARVRAKWNAMERTIAAEKARLAAEAKRIANAIKKQKEKNNRLAAAAAVNLNNAKNLNKVFKNNKTIMARLRRLVGK